MPKKKRQREGDADSQFPPHKKRAELIQEQNRIDANRRAAIQAALQTRNGISAAGTGADGPPGVRISNGSNTDAEERSGYQSLDLLEQILLSPPKAYTPSKLPPQKQDAPSSPGSQLPRPAKELPALPVIQDLNIAEAPFTHQGFLKDAAIADRGTSNLNYERLEFLGDAYLELIASRVILPRFPNFDPGKLSQTRQLLVCNETLADFSQRYDFHKRAHLPLEIRRKQDNNCHDKVWTKVMGDIFEAYVAALIISDPENGFATAENWLSELWEPLLATQVNPQVADAKAKQVLATKIMTKGTKITYRDSGPPEISKSLKGSSIFRVRAYYTGLGFEELCIGGGKGSSKAEAGYDAAANALHHPKLREIMAKKREFDLQAKAEREQQMAAEKKMD
ncbi:MAG: hypothetical protein LQ338_003610 [Usnochroma carphineum]|nr:MAG: hypothetical protein LQ338_003610 [Usnochroma carphineum]